MVKHLNTNRDINLPSGDIDNYLNWLENFLIVLLDKYDLASNEDIVNVIQSNNVLSSNETFIKEFLTAKAKQIEASKLIEKLPLLVGCPVDLTSNYCDFVNIIPMYKWELSIVKTLLSKLVTEYKGKGITPEIYHDYYEKEIAPYVPYFVNDYYVDGFICEKICPEIMCQFWSERIRDTISWEESWAAGNIVISVDSILKNDYLDRKKHLEDFRHLLKS